MVDVSDLLHIADPTRFVREAYLRILNRWPRDPEVRELVRTIEAGISKAYVIFCLVNSAEAIRRGVEFRGYWKPLTAPVLARLRGAHLVRAAFRSILWREPNSEELYSYLKSLSRSGRPEQAVLELSRAPEASRYPPLTGLDELRPRELSDLLPIAGDDAFLNEAYQSIFNRPADPDGLRTHLSALRRASRAQVLRAIVMSPEAQALPRQFVLNGELIAGASSGIEEPRGFRAAVAAVVARCGNLLLAGLQPRFAAIESRQEVLLETLAAVEERVGDGFSSALDRQRAQMQAGFDALAGNVNNMQAAFDRYRVEQLAAAAKRPVAGFSDSPAATTPGAQSVHDREIRRPRRAGRGYTKAKAGFSSRRPVTSHRN